MNRERHSSRSRLVQRKPRLSVGGALTLFLLLVQLSPPGAHAILRGGDIAIIGANSDDSDIFAWVAMVDIPTNTTIKFTDSSYRTGSSNYFLWTEHLSTGGPLTWASPTMLPRGSVVMLNTSGTGWSTGIFGGVAPSLDNNGDQIFAYTGTITTNGVSVGRYPYNGNFTGGNLLYGLNWGNSGWLLSGSGSANASYLPFSLGIFTNASVSANATLDNVYYAGPTRGTQRQLLDLISSPTNWVGSDTVTNTSSWSTSFQVFDAYRLATAGQTVSNMTATNNIGKSTVMTILNSSPLSSNSEVSASFATTNAANFSSDILRFSGTGTNTFVLQLSYDPTNLTLAQEQAISLNWYNPASNAWMNAVLGNLGGSATRILGAWNSSYGLGTYGVDTAANTAWAVLNHNSEFAVIPIPEPGLLQLAALGLLGLGLRSALGRKSAL